jgi:neutral amino acid transport system ATP-binding protein
MMSLIEVSDVSKAFGGLQALQSCSLNVEEGTIAGLIGPNGSGKTTLFNIMTGYEQLDTGTVKYQQETITNLPPEKIFRLGIGRTFQLTRIFPRLTVLENMHIAAQRKEGLSELFKSWTSTHEQRQALDLLDFVGLTALKEEQASSLSYGQKKLLEFALISVANPRVILLDEPASGINPTMISYLTERIRDLNKRGVTFLIVEHNMEFVMNLCSSLTVLHRGSKIAEGTAEQVRKNPAVLEAYLGE